MAKEFCGISMDNISASALDEKFIRTEYGCDDVFYVSKEIFHYDINNEDDGDFEYRYAIRVTDCSEYGDITAFSVEMHFVPLSKSNAEKVDTEHNVEDYLHSVDFIVDAVSEGYSILIGHKMFDFGSYDDEEAYKKCEEDANDLAIVGANIFETINSLRGFYLDKYVNRIGTTGWDMINDWVYEKGDYITATLDKYKQ